MKWSRLRFAIPAAIATLALGLTACGSNLGGDSGSGDEEGPIKIGAVLDITGVGANLGVPEQNTLKMLAKKLNDSGGIDGREVELIIKDNQSTEDGAAKATTQLIQDDKVNLLIGASRTGPSLAMRPIAEQNKIPLISVAANASIVEGSEWVFKTAQNDNVVIERILDDAQDKGYKKVALARDATGFGEGIADQITAMGKDRGIELTATESFEPSATDFTAQMTKLRSADADAVIIWGITPSAGLAQKAYKQIGVDKPVYQSHGVGNKEFFDAAGDSADGVIAPMGRLLVVDQLPADDKQADVIKAYVDDYKAEFGSDPSTFGGHAYDAWNVAVEAFKKAGTDPEKLRDTIESTTGLVGISGIFNFSKEDHSGLDASALILAVAKNGRWNLDKV
ncbi:ABC transporter substrate-binding protein [Saxibacter everestensis]|uniref:ABC transporter substrate-binding protein n=1 Tax=Saxibacter everestensis TaxID=2909229 RepID=A0ABY8QXH8_9MICO|nr:ABC transporter substrate-binding protein [Brevibacteriaceae bacterium ZFBP1038]